MTSSDSEDTWCMLPQIAQVIKQKSMFFTIKSVIYNTYLIRKLKFLQLLHHSLCQWRWLHPGMTLVAALHQFDHHICRW